MEGGIWGLSSMPFFDTTMLAMRGRCCNRNATSHRIAGSGGHYKSLAHPVVVNIEFHSTERKRLLASVSKAGHRLSAQQDMNRFQEETNHASTANTFRPLRVEPLAPGDAAHQTPRATANVMTRRTAPPPMQSREAADGSVAPHEPHRVCDRSCTTPTAASFVVAAAGRRIGKLRSTTPLNLQNPTRAQRGVELSGLLAADMLNGVLSCWPALWPKEDPSDEGYSGDPNADEPTPRPMEEGAGWKRARAGRRVAAEAHPARSHAMPPRDRQATPGRPFRRLGELKPGAAALTVRGRGLCPSVLADVRNFNHLTVCLSEYRTSIDEEISLDFATSVV